MEVAKYKDDVERSNGSKIIKLFIKHYFLKFEFDPVK